MSARRWFDDPDVIATHREGSDSEPEADDAVDFSGPIDVVNLLLVRAGVPGKHRAYVDALLGAADNQTDWFTANDLEIGRRIRGEDAERITKASIKKAAQRARDEFDEWQNAAHTTLVVSMPGGSPDGRTKLKTQYRLPVLALAQQVYAAARRHPLWQTRPDRAVSVEAKAALSDLRSEAPRRERFRRMRTVTVTMLVARAVRAIVKAVDLAVKRCGDPTDVMRELVEALPDEEREALTKAITERGVEHPADGFTVRSLREEYGTSEPVENVVPFPSTVDLTVDESVHGSGAGARALGTDVQISNVQTVDESVHSLVDSALEEVAREAEELFGSAEDAPEPQGAPVDPGGPLLVADTSGYWVEFGAIPMELQEHKRWAVFRRELNAKGAMAKLPYQPAKPTWKASSTNPKTWSTIAAARAVYENEANKFDGVYFTMGEDLGLVGVDLDHCVDEETGAIEAWALQVVHQLESYTELSPSRTGLRIFVKGTKPGERCRTGPKEMYVKRRFMSLTGWHLAGTPETIEERTEEIATLYHEWFPREEPKRPAIPPAPTLLADAELLEIGERIVPNFATLWAGNWTGYPSHSEGRMGLLSRLAYLTGGDEAQMVRLFRMSGLMSDKCETKRGGVSLVEYEAARAVAKATRFYEPRAVRRP